MRNVYMPPPTFHTANNRPTCRVVVKPNERGARIFPKGCKVRKMPSTTRQNKVVSYTKKGEKKRNIEIADTHVYIPVERNLVTRNFMYDTGASTLIMNERVAKLFKIINDQGTPLFPNARTTYYEDANDAVSEAIDIPNVPVTVKVRDKETNELINVDIKTKVGISKGSALLFGVSAIKALKKKGVKFKFRDSIVETSV